MGVSWGDIWDTLQVDGRSFEFYPEVEGVRKRTNLFTSGLSWDRVGVVVWYDLMGRLKRGADALQEGVHESLRMCIGYLMVIMEADVVAYDATPASNQDR